MIALLHPLVPKGAGKRVGTPVGPLPGKAARLVDDRDAVGHADRVGRRAERRRSAEADVALDDPGELVRAHRPDQTDVVERPQFEGRVAQCRRQP
jgi:hypothetical protein